MNWRTMALLAVICGLHLFAVAPSAHEEAVLCPESGRSTVEVAAIDVEVRIHIAHHPVINSGPVDAIRRGAVVIRAVIRVAVGLLDRWLETRGGIAEIKPSG